MDPAYLSPLKKIFRGHDRAIQARLARPTTPDQPTDPPRPAFMFRDAERSVPLHTFNTIYRLWQEVTTELDMHKEAFRVLTLEAEAASVRLKVAPRRPPMPRPRPAQSGSRATCDGWSCGRCRCRSWKRRAF